MTLVPGRFQTFNGSRIRANKIYAPCCEATYNKSDNTSQYRQKQPRDGCSGIILTLTHPHGQANNAQGTGDEAKPSEVNEPEHKVFLVAITHTPSNPWAMVIHFQDTFPAHGAVMGSIRLVAITLLAKPRLPVFFHHDGRVVALTSRQCYIDLALVDW